VELVDLCRAKAVTVRDAGSGEIALLSLRDAQEIAAAASVSLRDVELAALSAEICPVRYQRNLGTVGWEGQQRLLRSRVLVLGSGGLGGWNVEGLARMGVGTLVVVDADVFEENNLNRQLLATEATLGQPKAELAAARVRAVNGAVSVEAHRVWADGANLPDLLAGADVAVDALDTLPARMVLQRAAAEANVPLVHGAIAGYTGQVMTILPGDEGLYALYGRESTIPERGIETRLGNPAATPMMVAAWQIQEVVKLLTGKGDPLRYRLLLMDAESGEVDLLELAHSE
jgi:molybdopterin/thiamine biosynthesis adenylyltransferase